jgi:hypothetical protein
LHHALKEIDEEQRNLKKSLKYLEREKPNKGMNITRARGGGANPLKSEEIWWRRSTITLRAHGSCKG